MIKAAKKGRNIKNIRTGFSIDLAFQLTDFMDVKSSVFFV